MEIKNVFISLHIYIELSYSVITNSIANLSEKQNKIYEVLFLVPNIELFNQIWAELLLVSFKAWFWLCLSYRHN